MATINFSVRSKKNPSALYCRFSNTSNVDIFTPINLFVDPSTWDKSQQKIRNVISVPNRDKINRKLSLLKIHVIDDFNLAFMEGIIIDKYWLKKSIKTFFNRPKGEENNNNTAHTIYYVDFGGWWLKERSSTWITNLGKSMSDREFKKYEAFLIMFRRFEEVSKNKEKLKLSEISNNTTADFVKFMVEDDYSPKTIQRIIGRLKFFMNRAEEESITIDKSYKRRVFIPKPSEIKEPYLNPTEIELLYNHIFPKDARLDNARDNLIIGVWTGLRVSDFLGSLNIDNFIDDFIEITTQKTETPVTIPIHPMVKKILIKRNGQLPKKTSDVKFNLAVKEVCRAVKLNKMMEGRLYVGEKKRKVTGVYKKYKLVSSHICRRSFATNHFGKIPNQVIMKICGWTTEGMMLKYIKKSDKSYAVELQKYWETVY